MIYVCNDDNPKTNIENLGSIVIKRCDKCWEESK